MRLLPILNFLIWTALTQLGSAQNTTTTTSPSNTTTTAAASNTTAAAANTTAAAAAATTATSNTTAAAATANTTATTTAAAATNTTNNTAGTTTAASTTATGSATTTGAGDKGELDLPPALYGPGCVEGGVVTPIEIGQPMLFCLLIGNTANWSGGVGYTRVSFRPTADEYSRFHITKSYQELAVKENTIFDFKNITVAAAVQNRLSFLRMYRDIEVSKVYPHLTAIIDVEDGLVRGITWDDGCLWCAPNKCAEVTYNYSGYRQTQETSGQATKGCEYLEEDMCNVMSNVTLCDLTVYVVWTGTDAKRVAFQSSAMRFSQFPAQELSNRIWQTLPQMPEVPKVPEVKLPSLMGGGSTQPPTAAGGKTRRQLHEQELSVEGV